MFVLLIKSATILRVYFESIIRHMKNAVIFSVIFLFTGLCAHAQTQNKSSNDSLSKKSSPIVTFSELDQTKIYHWANGQRATATGREAGEHLPNYVKLIGDDSAVVVKGPKGEPWK